MYNNSTFGQSWSQYSFRDHLKEDEQTLYDHLDERTYRYLPASSLGRALDVIFLVDLFEQLPARQNTIHDWQFIVMPLCLITEEVLFKIATEMGMVYRPRATIGQVFVKENIQKLIDKIEDNKKKSKVERLLNDIGGFIQNYRNDPMHASQKYLLSNFLQAKNKIGAIFDAIKGLIEALDDEGLIVAIKHRKISGNGAGLEAH